MGSTVDDLEQLEGIIARHAGEEAYDPDIGLYSPRPTVDNNIRKRQTYPSIAGPNGTLIQGINLTFNIHTKTILYVEFTMKEMDRSLTWHEKINPHLCFWDGHAFIIPITETKSARYSPDTDHWETGTDFTLQEKLQQDKRQKVADGLFEYLKRMGV